MIGVSDLGNDDEGECMELDYDKEENELEQGEIPSGVKCGLQWLQERKQWYRARYRGGSKVAPIENSRQVDFAGMQLFRIGAAAKVERLSFSKADC
ncbi:hypothetical protein NDU88_002842 [Pleurodeles waltl]|uniref:Uncharacterized protein n=1 Tax=Pleurodeles waltl TaxID=8319 RepID=A0AAV7M1T8_PLEWA|nr:hypothetical protein NDU88_002842 [Pleurodeles waltl]